MQTLKRLMLAAAIGAVAILTASANSTVLLNGPAFTNATVVLQTGTNGAGGFTYSTNQVGVVATTATNYYNMPALAGIVPGQSAISVSQSNGTNWPSSGFPLMGYPNTLYGPSSLLLDNKTVILNVTNSSSTLITFHYAGFDGNQWTSNAFVQTITVPVNTLLVAASTNWTTGGWQAVCLQQVDNPGATGSLTNLYDAMACKPGL